MSEFHGPATKFSNGAIATAAIAIGCDIAAIKTVIAVESSGGGFLEDRRPKILFERHVFSKRTGGRFDSGHPDISSPKPGGYGGEAAQYGRLERAIALDRRAALESASWGAFQIMGYHFEALKFADVDTFCFRMCQSEDDHLQAFAGFIKINHLADELRDQNWKGFARGYNGPQYRKNKYDTKLADAYARLSGPPTAPVPAPVIVERTLRMGDEGDDVKLLQGKLGIAADGDFGPSTKAAVTAFQEIKGLKPDGIVGIRTQQLLGL